MKQFLKNAGILGALITSIMACVTGEFSIAKTTVGSAVASLEGLIRGNAAYPIATMFFVGLLIAWAIFGVGHYFSYGRFQRARKKLGLLRKEGTEIRIEGMQIATLQEFIRWKDKPENWNARVIKAIEKIDEPDSLSFATLGYPGNTREYNPLPKFISEDHKRIFCLHDVREQRLEAFITKYSVQAIEMRAS